MKKKLYWLGGVVFAVLLFAWFFSPEGEDDQDIYVYPKKGDFAINVTTTGELEAENSEKIYGPQGLRNVRIWNVKIEDIIPDGTVVDSGDFVATLDRSELTNKLKDQELELETLESQMTKTSLDTSMTLRSARDELVNLAYALEERQIEVDQSIYEPPATQRQAQINLDKATRALSQANENYDLKRRKAVAEMVEVTAKYRKADSKYISMVEVLSKFSVFAPKSGMVIYKRDWDGKKLGVGGQISAWDPVVATLPDLTSMITKTYVNEIDISKVKAGQQVTVSIDAFPDKSFTGEVQEVANIGEQLSNSNAKVFEVLIIVNEYDSIMRPAMTTKNVIQTALLTDVVYVPLECVHSNDSINYVIRANKHKQQVVLGESNENEIILLAGVNEGDELYLTLPLSSGEYTCDFLDQTVLDQFKKADTLNAEDEVKPQVPSKKGARKGEGRKRGGKPGGNSPQKH